MRIILVSPLGKPTGGIVTWTEEYLNSLIKKENEVILINTIKNRKHIKYISDIIQIIKIFFKLRGIRLSQNDYLHINTSCAKLGIIRDYLIVKYASIRRVKIIVQYHCDIEDMVTHKFQLKLLNKISTIANMNLVLNRKSFIFLKQFDLNNRMQIFPNFISEERVKRINKKRIVKDKIEKVIYTGHIKRSKGCNKIIEIAKKLTEKEFVLVGKICEEYFFKENLSNVTYTGELSQNEVENILNEGDLFLFLSETEGFPNSILEAMAAELPIIATKVGAIEEMLEKNIGIVDKEDSLEKIISLIRFLDDSKERREILGLKNLQLVKKKYLKEKVIRRLIEIYEKIE